MNNLTIIDERMVLGKEFRIYGDFENPLFLAKDVAEWVEHSDVSMMLKTIDSREKLKIITPQIMLVGLQPNTAYWFLTEDGLYEVLMQSRKPIAKAFKKEVKEILKTIRKYGVYATDEKLEQILLSPEFAIRVFTALKEEREAKKALEVQIENNRPKVEFANSVETAKTTILIADLAKILNQNGVNIGQNRLFKWLRENNFLGVKGEYYNLPTQTSMDKKLFEIKETGWYDNGGNYHINKVTKVTGKGQIYFINRLKKELATA